MEDEYKVACAISNSATSMTLSDKANVSQTVHPIHSMFGSRLRFLGSANRTALFAVR